MTTMTAPTTKTVFDLGAPAENGLRRGFTTGTGATAAVKAALLCLLYRRVVDAVTVSLPDGRHLLPVPVDRVFADGAATVRAEVVKEAGDDPDQTHRARLFARVRANDRGRVVFLRGEGVGLVTRPGLAVGVGEPAINPVPRRMIQTAVDEVLAEAESPVAPGFDVELGCVNGAEIARRTFNPRLGIEGGISILGTTGIVEPKSMAAFQASVEIYVGVALGGRPSEIVLSPGNLGQRFARESLGLPLSQIVQTSNFFGFALDRVEAALEAQDARLTRLWVAGHPGKLAKLLAGEWDTHSGRSGAATLPLTGVAAALGRAPALVAAIREANTAEAAADLLAREPDAVGFWREVERRVAAAVAPRVTRADQVRARLFRLDGTPLGAGGTEP